MAMASMKRLSSWSLRAALFRRLSVARLLLLSLLCLALVLVFANFYSHTFGLVTSSSAAQPVVVIHQDLSPDNKVQSPSSSSFGQQPRLDQPQPLSSLAPKCVFPSLDIKDRLMTSFMKTVPPFTCQAHGLDWVHVHNGTLVFSEEARKRFGGFTCDASPLVRGPGDNRVSWGAPVRNFASGAKMEADFVKVECLAAPSKDGGGPSAPQSPNPGPPQYTEVLMGVSPSNQAVWERLRTVRPPANGLSGLSVLMLGFDSMSRMSWLRRMPATREYLVNELGGIELEGYNIMGDGTPAALFPILTGKHEVELPESRRNHPGAKPVDDYPWIWKDFAKVGYVTSWADAEVHIAPFNYRLLGFHNLPTDYFIRPYYLAIRDNQNVLKHRPGCRGHEPKHQAWFHWARDLYHMYGNQPKFMMHFYATLSHDNNDKITLADKDFRTFLQDMEAKGYLNSTILVVFGDHGARYTNVRQTWSGRLEERLPYMTFRFPPWFEQKYPQLMRNFRTNVGRLSTPMDIHETLWDVIKFDGAGKGDIRKRGISLFKEIPAERECRHADIRNHWCACLDWKNISEPERDPKAQLAVQTAVGFINNLTEPYRNLCAKLEVDNVTSGQSLQANDDFLNFHKTIDKDGRKPHFDHSSKEKLQESVVLYQMSFRTKPGKGLFEVTITQKGPFGWATSEKDISRINAYGEDPSCILNINRQLRQFCYCNNLIKES